MSIQMSKSDKDFFYNEGYLVVKSLFNTNEVNELKNEFEKHWLELVGDGTIKVDSNRPLYSLYPRFRDFHRKNKTIMEYATDSRVFQVIEALIKEEALLIATSYYFKSPGTKGLPLHQDNYAFGVEPGTTYALWISLDDSDRENGGMRFVPGTHRMDLMLPNSDPTNMKQYFSDKGQRIDVPSHENYVDIETAAGDVIIFNGNIIHGSTDNLTTNRFRRSLLLHFTGASVEKLALNFNNLVNKSGERVRRRLNTRTKIVERQESVFAIKEAEYFDDWIK